MGILLTENATTHVNIAKGRYLKKGTLSGSLPVSRLFQILGDKPPDNPLRSRRLSRLE